MIKDEIMAAIDEHRAACAGHFFSWFAGVQIAPRLHPWDEQELSFPIRVWLNLNANTGEEAQTIVQQLFTAGCAKSPLHSNLPTAKCVFVYALPLETTNSL
jgi:hypothetical protein